MNSVDVLAVMDAAAAKLQLSHGQAIADDVRKARTVICELIEAASGGEWEGKGSGARRFSFHASARLSQAVFNATGGVE